MIYFTLRIRPETPDLDAAIETLGAQAFGPGRFARAAFRLREGVRHEPEFSFVALMQDAKGRESLAGSIRLTRILIGGEPALVLGPLVVSPQYKNLGIGRELSLQFVLGYTPDEFGSALVSIAEGKVDLSSWLTGTVGVDGVPQAFTDLGNPDAHAKILVVP